MDFQDTKVWVFPFYIEITLQCSVSLLYNQKRKKLKYAENNYKQDSF